MNIEKLFALLKENGVEKEKAYSLLKLALKSLEAEENKEEETEKADNEENKAKKEKEYAEKLYDIKF